MKKVIETERIKKILLWIPIIKNILREANTLSANVDKWLLIKPICEKLGLNDTAFREYPRIDDFLLDDKYWESKLDKVQQTLALKRLGLRKEDQMAIKVTVVYLNKERSWDHVSGLVEGKSNIKFKSKEGAYITIYAKDAMVIIETRED